MSKAITAISQNTRYLESQAARESNARSYPRRIPIAIAEAEGIYVKDMDGKNYIDCLAGAGTLALGHNHPVVLEAIRELLDQKRPLHTLDLTTPVKEQFVEELFASLPRKFARQAKIQFCGPTGGDAVEAAIKLVKTATGRRSIFSFQGGYHGSTHATMSLSGTLGQKERVQGLIPDVHFMPYPYVYRCPFGVGGEQTQALSSCYIENLLDDPESGIATPCAFILEVVQGEGGSIPAPVEWIREIRRITRERNIPMIIDEVQTGLGRTGKLFAFEHAGIIPDVLVLSKAIGGSLPLSVVIYNEALDIWNPGAHIGTFRGNPNGHGRRACDPEIYKAQPYTRTCRSQRRTTNEPSECAEAANRLHRRCTRPRAYDRGRDCGRPAVSGSFGTSSGPQEAGCSNTAGMLKTWTHFGGWGKALCRDPLFTTADCNRAPNRRHISYFQ